MAARRTTFRSRAPARRKRVWARDRIQILDIPDAGVAVQLGLAFAADLGMQSLPPGSTIGGVFVTGVIRHELASTAANTGVTFGIGVFDETTDVHVPRPIPDEHVDWMYFQALHVGLAAGSSYAFQGADGIRVKSMRKIEEIHERLWLSVQPNATLDAGNSYDFIAVTSTLVLLP